MEVFVTQPINRSKSKVRRGTAIITLAHTIHLRIDLGIGGRNAGQPSTCSLHLICFCSNRRTRSPERSELSRPYQKLYQQLISFFNNAAFKLMLEKNSWILERLVENLDIGIFFSRKANNTIELNNGRIVNKKTLDLLITIRDHWIDKS
jgi:hypothetical protein